MSSSPNKGVSRKESQVLMPEVNKGYKKNLIYYVQAH
jgi:hypothetical protein